jgi:hypothetical protein
VGSGSVKACVPVGSYCDDTARIACPHSAGCSNHRCLPPRADGDACTGSIECADGSGCLPDDPGNPGAGSHCGVVTPGTDCTPRSIV